VSAATIAQYDSAWAAQNNWGAMINLLIKDSNNWERNDFQFPF
jgi:endoglucanase Acf2